jgi:hypothetical protein
MADEKAYFVDYLPNSGTFIHPSSQTQQTSPRKYLGF